MWKENWSKQKVGRLTLDNLYSLFFWLLHLVSKLYKDMAKVSGRLESRPPAYYLSSRIDLKGTDSQKRTILTDPDK